MGVVRVAPSWTSESQRASRLVRRCKSSLAVLVLCSHQRPGRRLPSLSIRAPPDPPFLISGTAPGTSFLPKSDLLLTLQSKVLHHRYSNPMPPPQVPAYNSL